MRDEICGYLLEIVEVREFVGGFGFRICGCCILLLCLKQRHLLSGMER